MTAVARIKRADPTGLRDYGILIAFVALFLTLAITSDAFLTKTNLLNILNQWAPTGVIACGGTLVIIAGGFDLSVGAIFAIAGVAAAFVARDVNVPLGFAAGIAMGFALGTLNGILTTRGRINPFIATLASSLVFRGLAVLMTSGFLVTVTQPGFTTVGRDKLFDVNYTVYVFAAVVVVTGFVLARTTFGRYVYAAGGNPEAARLSGVRVDAVKAATFAISGALAGVAGVMAASRVATGQADAGVGLELTAIAAVVIGGTSILGGEGAIWRTVCGVLLLAMLGNGLTLLGVQTEYQQMIQGGIILAAVGLDAWARQRSAAAT